MTDDDVVLHGVAESLSAVGVPAPLVAVKQVVTALTTDGRLRGQYAALDEDHKRQMLVDMIDPKLDEMQEQLDQLVTLMHRLLGSAPLNVPTGPSRFLRLLDRTPIWNELQLACLEGGHRSFIVHGSSRENVELFCARVRERAGVLKPGHDFVDLNHSVAQHRAELAEDWERHLEYALGGPTGLAEHTAKRPLLIMLCDGAKPLRSKRPGDKSGLGKQGRIELGEFLHSTLPAQIKAAQCRHPVRVLVPIEYEFSRLIPEDPLYLEVRRRLRETPMLQYAELLPMTFPSWDDVRKSLYEILGHDLGTTLLYDCRAAFDGEEAKREHERSFYVLARALDAVLDRHAESD